MYIKIAFIANYNASGFFFAFLPMVLYSFDSSLYHGIPLGAKIRPIVFSYLLVDMNLALNYKTGDKVCIEKTLINKRIHPFLNKRLCNVGATLPCSMVSLVFRKR